MTKKRSIHSKGKSASKSAAKLATRSAKKSFKAASKSPSRSGSASPPGPSLNSPEASGSQPRNTDFDDVADSDGDEILSPAPERSPKWRLLKWLFYITIGVSWLIAFVMLITLVVRTVWRWSM